MKSIDDNKKSEFIQSKIIFFKKNITDANSKRLSFNRNRNFIKYFVKPKLYSQTWTPISFSWGIFSFSIYLLRLLLNIFLLSYWLLTQPAPLKSVNLTPILYEIVNDLLWSTCNLIQFFWWTFEVSKSAGYKGLQFEAIAQYVDCLIMIVRFHQEYQNQNAHKNTLSTYHYLQFIRSLLTLFFITLVLSLFAFSAITLPLSPIIFFISLSSTFIRMGINYYQYQSSSKRLKETETFSLETKKELSQFILDYVLIPLGFYLMVTTPLVISIISILILALIYQGAQKNLSSSQTQDIDLRRHLV